MNNSLRASMSLSKYIVKGIPHRKLHTLFHASSLNGIYYKTCGLLQIYFISNRFHEMRKWT